MSAPGDAPAFDTAERDRRWGRIRKEMAEQGIDLLVVLPESNADDVLYVAQEMGAVLFPLDGDPWIVIGGEDSNLAVARHGWIDQRTSATASGVNRFSYGTAVADALERLQINPRRVAVAGLDGSRYSHVRSLDGYVVHATIVRIMAVLSGAELVNGSDVLGLARYVKSEAEIDAVRFGVNAAEAAASLIGDAYRVGADQAAAYRAGYAALLQPGLTGAAGPVPNIAWCPGQWGEHRPRMVSVPSGKIDDGLCVTVEIVAVSRGYFAQTAQSFIAGEVSAEQREAFALNIAAFNAARDALLPGVTWREVKEATLAVATGTGWAVTFLLHGGPHGPMLIPHDRHDDWLDDEVEENTVHMCKPHVYPAAQSDEMARSHELTWGDMVVVRPDGAQRLGTRPQTLGTSLVSV
ncbi:M24 family metallopeptidase [Mycobacterium antarcticum]|uniref:M24 family metallopeptidase n=1 Tax=Mycolicibacterium sp. TUM20985 TaxID=3023370 RepID=UPI0025748D1A|nr:M24 family metallopeptidase [Mycolicibacterium sp. TUM20985]